MQTINNPIPAKTPNPKRGWRKTDRKSFAIPPISFNAAELAFAASFLRTGPAFDTACATLEELVLTICFVNSDKRVIPIPVKKVVKHGFILICSFFKLK